MPMSTPMDREALARLLPQGGQSPEMFAGGIPQNALQGAAPGGLGQGGAGMGALDGIPPELLNDPRFLEYLASLSSGRNPNVGEPQRGIPNVGEPPAFNPYGGEPPPQMLGGR